MGHKPTHNGKRLTKSAKFMAVLALLCFANVLLGQSPTEKRDTTPKDLVDVEYADLLENIQRRGVVRQKLSGNVELSQDSIYLFCDSAIIEDSIRVEAIGNVIIEQGDSISIFGDSLFYNAFLRQADLYGEVDLVSGPQRLLTNSLHYDLKTKLATYTEGATLLKDSTQLSSKRGYFYVETNEVYFKDSVVVIDTNFNLRADTLKYHTQTNIVTFLGPTVIYNDTSKIYCEAGFYDLERRVAEFTQNAQFKRQDQIASADKINYNGATGNYRLVGNARFREEERRAAADTILYNERNETTTLFGNARYRDATEEIEAPRIVYNAKSESYTTRGRSRISDPPQILEANQVDYREESGMGIALGNVIWRDTSAELTIRCDTANYDRRTNYLKAIGGRRGRPMMISLVEGDSLYLASDTLTAITEDTLQNDSNRVFLAYHDVRIYKSNLQAVCDSLTYHSQDSLFRLFRNPLLWSDTSQFKADTIHMSMKSGQIDRVFLIEDALILNSPDQVYYNQVKGKDITAFFRDEQLRRMQVEGNAESIYYAKDDFGAYVGVNYIICSEMMLFFGDNQVESIKFFTQPDGKAYPMRQVNHEKLKLEGVRWYKERRPTSLNDLFPAVARQPPPPRREEAKPESATSEDISKANQ